MSIKLKDTITDSIDKLDGQHSSYFAHTIKVGTSTTEYNSTNSIITLPAYPTIPTIPTTLPNPKSLTIQANGISLGSYSGSSALTVNLTYSNVGAAKEDHSHTQYFDNTTSRTKNHVLAAPNGSAGPASFRALVAADIPSLAISKITNLQTTLDNKADSDSYLPLAGGTMTARTGYISFLTEASTSVTDSTAFAITYGKIQGAAPISIIGDTDGSGTEYVIITSGYTAANATAENGLAVGKNTLTWKGTNISLSGHTHNYAGSSSPGGSAASAVKLDSSAGSTTLPIYFKDGKPTACGTSLAVSITGNAATATSATSAGSATKLATSRTIWGQSFNGESNISGNLTGVGSITRTNNGAVNEDTAGNLVWGSETTDDNNWNVMTSSISRQFSVTKTGLVGINTGTTIASSKLSVNACVSDITAGQYKGDIFSIGINGQYGTHIWTRGNGVGYIQVGRQDGGSPSTYDLHLQPHGGNCLIGTGYAMTSTNWTSYIDCFRDRGLITSSTINTTTQGAFYTVEYTPIGGLYNYGTVLNFRSYPTTTQFYIPDGQAGWGNYAGEIWFRNAWNGQESQGGSWFRIITSKNIGEYSVGGGGAYLPLSGGTLTGDLYFSHSNGINNSIRSSLLPAHFYRAVWDTAGNVYDHYYNSSYSSSTNTYANLRVKSGSGFQTLLFGGDGTFTWCGNTVWHSGNITFET